MSHLLVKATRLWILGIADTNTDIGYMQLVATNKRVLSSMKNLHC